MPKPFEGWEYCILPGEGMWILKRLMPHLWKNPKPSVFYAPSHYLPPFLPMPMVCAITDLGYLANSAQFTKYDFWQLKYWSAISMWRARKILTISESTKKDILKNYSFKDSKIVSIPLGYDKNTFNQNVPQEEVERVKKKYKIQKDYILFLSTLKPSKNIEGILTAYKALQDEKGVKEVLVIAGKKGWLYDPIFRQVQELGLTKNVIFTDFIDEEDKAPLLSGAKVFVAHL
jgi:glycosyltransferase involved in cell wall biosynthesis